MAWQKIIDLPDQRFIGPYGIEYWRVAEGQVFHQGRLLRKADAASFEFMPAHPFIGRDAQRSTTRGAACLQLIATASASAARTGWTTTPSTSSTRPR